MTSRACGILIFDMESVRAFCRHAAAACCAGLPHRTASRSVRLLPRRHDRCGRHLSGQGMRRIRQRPASKMREPNRCRD